MINTLMAESIHLPNCSSTIFDLAIRQTFPAIQYYNLAEGII